MLAREIILLVIHYVHFCNKSNKKFFLSLVYWSVYWLKVPVFTQDKQNGSRTNIGETGNFPFFFQFLYDIPVPSVETRVGTKGLVFFFSRKFSRKLTFRFREIFVTKKRNFRESIRENFSRKLRDEKALKRLWTKILFLIIHKQKICIYFFVLSKQF
jgi:hypothetical protein